MGTREEVGRDTLPIILDGKPRCSPRGGLARDGEDGAGQSPGVPCFTGPPRPLGSPLMGPVLGWDPYGLANLARPGLVMEPGLGGGADVFSLAAVVLLLVRLTRHCRSQPVMTSRRPHE